MTVRWSCFGFRDRILVAILVCLIFICCSAGENARIKESRKLFGGYRITPSYCKASRASRNNRGPTICMFNHECVQRKGEVVGACMDGFLFGACCQLVETSELHIPKGPGIVVDDESFDDIDESDRIAEWHESFKPQVKPGYHRNTTYYNNENDIGLTVNKYVTSTSRTTSTEILNDGVSQITNALLSTPPKENTVIYIKPNFNKTDLYSFSTISNYEADTVLYNKNGSTVENIARPSDFNVQISSMQTKPTPSPSKMTRTPFTTPKTVSTHRPIYQKPQFKPKTTKKPTQSVTTSPTTEKYILVHTITKTPNDTNSVIHNPSDLSSINSILQMLNDTKDTVVNITKSPPLVKNTTTQVKIETKSTPSPHTNKPVQYSTRLPTTTSRVPFVTTIHPSATGYIPTLLPHRTSTIYTNIIQSQRPISEAISEVPNPSSNFNHFSTIATQISSESPLSSTSSARPPTTSTTRKPPSTSYVYNSKPSKRPVTNSPIGPSYDVAPETFGSVTPTVIVLNSYSETGSKVPPLKAESDRPDPVNVDEPHKKPINQITINNVISSTNNLMLGQKPSKPSSNTVNITPKPTNPPDIRRPITTVSYSTTDNYYSSSVVPNRHTSPTTLTPELQTSPDDLINFPPVRNPNLNATGSNIGLYNSTVSSDLYLPLPDVEFTTPSFLQEDAVLSDKMNLFVNKIVGSLQGTFQELHDIVILDKKPNSTVYKPDTKLTTAKPNKKPSVSTKKPIVTTKKTPVKASTIRTTTRKPPIRITTTTRRSTTQAYVSTKKPATTTKKQRPTKRATTTTAAPTTTFTPVTSVASQQYDETNTEAYQDNDIDYSDNKLCGVRPMVKSGRIVGGKNAAFAEWPWQVLVRESTWLGLFTKNKCGGVLITSRYVTTAAHCQPGFLASLVAVFGEHDISGDLERKKPVSRNVRRVVVHRQYDAATFENDLAILELESPIHFDAHIIPICMPPDESDFTGRMATVTGWGRLKYGGGVPAILQEVQVPVIENSVCQEMFQTAGHNKVILNSFLCAGYANGQKDSCEGDSGGPLVLQRPDGKWQLVGTVSHGIKCASPYLPGVYMRTTFYKPWLRSVTGIQ